MTVLSRNAILEHLHSGELVIDPFNPGNLQPNSYDLSLGENFWVLAPKGRENETLDQSGVGYNKTSTEISSFRSAYLYETIELAAYWNPYNEADAHSGYTLRQAEPWKEICDRLGFLPVYTAYKDFPETAEVFLLPPYASVMGHSKEFAGSASPRFCTMLKTRSSWARVGVSFNGSAGWGDNGFFGRWGLRITNNTPYVIPLLVGSRVAQLVFLQTTGDALDADYCGKYQPTKDLEELRHTWKPESLLPKLWKDVGHG